MIGGFLELTLTDQTLFEKFLFLDRANQDIGEEAIINIWDISKIRFSIYRY